MSILSELKTEETEVLSALVGKLKQAETSVREYAVYIITKSGLDPQKHGITNDLKNFVELELPEAVETVVEKIEEEVKKVL